MSESKSNTPDPPRPRPPLAIVGVSALYPGSTEVDGFWRDILRGRDLIDEVPPHYWLVEDFYDPDPRAPDKTYCKRGAFLSKVDFDPIGFGIPPANLSSTDTCQLLALMVARRVMEDAARSFEAVDRERVSVILGVAAGLELLGEMSGRLQRPLWIKALREHGLPEDEVQTICDRIASHSVPWTESTFPGLLGNVVTGRIANRFDLGGTNCTCDAACASSFSALSMAASELYLGDSDLVITGGVDTTNDPFLFMCFCKTPAMSLKNDCRPFSSDADGTMLGEGLGMVALRRLADAERDGDPIYAVIRGIGTSSDGRAKSVYAPSPEGQARALRRAYTHAGYGPETVELVEAHGTGTVAGDVAEFEGLRQVFDGVRPEHQWCALGSIKSQLGHTKAAAGVAGLIKVALALQNRVLPPTIKVDEPDPRLKIESSAFYLNTRARPWIAAAPRRGSVSSFGFGGTNFHITLEEYRGPGPEKARRRVLPSELVLVGARGADALAARCRGLAEEVESGGAGMLGWLAWSSQREGFASGQEARVALVASDEVDLAGKLRQAADAVEKRGEASFSLPSGIHYGRRPSGPQTGRVAFLFSGQGSQYLEMGADLAMHFELAQDVWDRLGARELEPGWPLHRIVFPRPVFGDEERDAQARRLTATEWAQPAIGVSSLAILELLRAARLEPSCVGGHSFGEVTALHAAGALSEDDLLRVARRRGELMAEAGRDVPASMTAVVCAADELRRLLADVPDVTVANINSPRQTVLSGPTPAIEAAEDLLRGHKLRTRRLPVSTAFHSPVVEHAAHPFVEHLSGVELRPPELPVYANSEAAPYPDGPPAMREILGHQIARPVRFAEQVEAMWEAGARIFVEVGPGSVLTGLVDQCLEGREHLAVSTDRKGTNGVTALWNALGQLAVAGVELSLTALWADGPEVTDPRQVERPKLVVPMDGVNHGKIYPPPGGAASLPKPNTCSPVGRAGGADKQTHEPAMANTEKTPPRAEEQSTNTAQPAPQAQPMPVVQPALPQAQPMPAVQPAPPRASADWLQAFQEIQRQTAEAHAAYQRAMADSHVAFLRTAEAASLHLHSALTGQPVPELPEPVSVPAPAPQPVTAPAPPPPAWSAPPPSQVMEPPPPVEARPEPPKEEASPVPASPPEPAGGLEVVDFKELLLDVVAEKTGYPLEILTMEMELEADLGIDSIKRVEILSALQERLPGLPEVDASEIPTLQTLGQVLEFVEAQAATLGEGGNGNGSGSAEAAQREEPPPRIERAMVREVISEVGGETTSLLAGLEPGSTVAVVDGGSGLAGPLIERLGCADLETVDATVHGVPEGAAAVIFLGGLAPVESPEQAIAVNRRAFEVAQRVAPRLTESGGLFVTVQDTGGDFGLSGRAGDRAWLCGLSALAKTGALEWPKARVKAIDLERGERLAEELVEVLAREITAGGPELEVGLHADGSRATLESEVRPPADHGEPVVDRDSVLLVSGGARGVTAATLLELARRFRPRLALLGRTPIDVDEPEVCRGVADDAGLKRALLGRARDEGVNVSPAEVGAQAARILAAREARRTLELLEGAGASARYFALDVRDRSALDRALGEVREAWGPVTGVIHGAGVLADKTIADKTADQFDRVFDTKVEGLRALLAATRDDPLRLICVFSSVAARFGNVGQSDYAMANEIVGRVAAAEARRRDGKCLVRAIDWGPWDGGMVTPALRGYFKGLGVPLIPLETGARMLIDELRLDGAGPGGVEVVIGGAPSPDRLTAPRGGARAGAPVLG
jgi:acyl transferase domain-containing protein/NAD(P)-dependent dehydrogenase (short-subunit alcohol dehydrogenase family)/acyl carrier protein